MDLEIVIGSLGEEKQFSSAMRGQIALTARGDSEGFRSSSYFPSKSPDPTPSQSMPQCSHKRLSKSVNYTDSDSANHINQFLH